MKLFACQNCGQLVYFENVRCERCGHLLGYLPDLGTMSAVEPEGPHWHALADGDTLFWVIMIQTTNATLSSVPSGWTLKWNAPAVGSRTVLVYTKTWHTGDPTTLPYKKAVASSDGNLVFALFTFVVYFNLLNLGQGWVAGGRIGLIPFMLLLHGGTFLAGAAWLAKQHNNWTLSPLLTRRLRRTAA